MAQDFNYEDAVPLQCAPALGDIVVKKAASTNAGRQGCLFEEDFLRRTLGPVANTPDVALTELVANAWDAGAATVEITIPDDFDQSLIVEDDGTGMSSADFRKKWMTLGYDRVRQQGFWAEFPAERAQWKRPAYGRNGIGRHGMLCFASEYQVETRRDGALSLFTVSTATGDNPFELLREDRKRATGHGTKLLAKVTRNLPSADRVRQVLSARFLHDPQFQVKVNGRFIPLAEHEGLIDRESLRFGDGSEAEAFFVDSTKSARTTQYQGVAFWVGGRLVGDPSWAIGSHLFLDGRTRIAKRFTVVIKSDDLFDEVNPDWTGFQKSEKIESLYNAVAEYVQSVFAKLSAERIQDTTEAVFREHKAEIRELHPLAKIELQEFVSSVTKDQPTIQPETLSSALRAVINLERSRSGSALIEKLAKLSEKDVEGLDRLLSEWTVRDALTVLDEIDRRLIVVEAISKLSGDSKTDELHALHPLVTESRWLFGPEFDSPEFVANVSLATAMREIFGKRSLDQTFRNPRKRTDLLVLADATVSGVATEQVDDRSGLAAMKQILLIELKRGALEVTREHVHQATDYVEDFLRSGLLDRAPTFKTFVVGHRISDKVEPFREIPPRATIQLTTYGQLVRSAHKRLFRLRERLTTRYEEVSGTDLLAKILAEPEQLDLLE
jgi:hypothetical protein